MATTETKLPKDNRAIRMDPDLAKALEGVLEPYSGKDLEKAQAALLKVRESGASGSFAELVEHYRQKIAEAVGK